MRVKHHLFLQHQQREENSGWRFLLSSFGRPFSVVKLNVAQPASVFSLQLSVVLSLTFLSYGSSVRSLLFLLPPSCRSSLQSTFHRELQRPHCVQFYCVNVTLAFFQGSFWSFCAKKLSKYWAKGKNEQDFCLRFFRQRAKIARAGKCQETNLLSCSSSRLSEKKVAIFLQV